MAHIIKNRQIIEDSWQTIADDAELPTGSVLISLARWNQERAALLERSDPLGVRLPNTANIADLVADLPHWPVVALEFPKFADGRAYSQARLLRERYGYQGEIRAVGDVFAINYGSWPAAVLTPLPCGRIAVWKMLWRDLATSAKVISRGRISPCRCTGAGGSRKPEQCIQSPTWCIPRH